MQSSTNKLFRLSLIAFLSFIIAVILLRFFTVSNHSYSGEDKHVKKKNSVNTVARGYGVRSYNTDEHPNVPSVVSKFAIINDPKELKECFRKSPKEVIDALEIMAVENLDPNCSDLLGKLIHDYYGAEEGAEYIDQGLQGFVREWTRIGFGAALLAGDRDDFQAYILKMNLCSARDNLVAMAVVEIGKTDAMGAYQLWSQERDAVGGGSSPAKDMMVSKMVQNLARQITPEELQRLIYSKSFFERGSNEVEQVSLVLSQSSPLLALNWAVDRQVKQEVRDQIMFDLSKRTYGSQGESEEIEKSLSLDTIKGVDAIASISSNIDLNTAGKRLSYDNLVDQYGWIANKMPTTESNLELKIKLGNVFAKQDLRKALEFATTVPSGRARDGYIDGVVSVILETEPEQVSDIINQIADDEIYQAVSGKLYK